MGSVSIFTQELQTILIANVKYKRTIRVCVQPSVICNYPQLISEIKILQLPPLEGVLLVKDLEGDLSIISGLQAISSEKHIHRQVIVIPICVICSSTGKFSTNTANAEANCQEQKDDSE
jgi:hypothetical protein